MQLIIAIADGGMIQELDGWREPRKPFRVFVAKADLVPDKIDAELKRYRSGTSLLATGEYGLWSMELPEVRTVAEFLAEWHAPIRRVPAESSNSPGYSGRRNRSGMDAARATPAIEIACVECGATDLTARSGRFGYHWRCGACGKNTKIPVECTACGARGKHDDAVVKIRKRGPEYFRDCEACGISEIVWVEV